MVTSSICVPAALEVNKDLKALRLAHNDIGDDGVRFFFNLFGACLELNIGGNMRANMRERPKAPGLFLCALAGILVLAYLSSLYLVALHLLQAAGLARMLERNNSLTELNLSYNPIGNAGAVQLISSLRGDSVLSSIDVSFNAIDDKGILAIGASI